MALVVGSCRSFRIRWEKSSSSDGIRKPVDTAMARLHIVGAFFLIPRSMPMAHAEDLCRSEGT